MSHPTILEMYRKDYENPRPDHYTHATLSGPRVLSTREFFTRTAALSTALASMGVSHGDHVLLLSDNRPEWHIADLAVLALGAADVPIYPTLTPDQVAYQAADSESCVAIAENAEQMQKFLAKKGELPLLTHLIQIEGTCADGVVSLDELVAAHGGVEAEKLFWERAAAVQPDDLASIVYTSGTTGPPKGAMLTHANFTSNVIAVLPRVPLDRNDVGLEFLPLCHVFERTVGYAYMETACKKAYCIPSVVAEVIREVRPTTFASVPRLYEKIHATIMSRVETAPNVRKKLFLWAVETGRQAAHRRLAGTAFGPVLGIQHALADKLVLSKIREALGARVKFCLSGGAPLAASLGEFFHSVGVPIQEGYGLTETSPAIGINGCQPGENRLGAIGKPLENLEVKLAADGELLVKGPSIFKGYWNKPEATAEVFDDEGFFHTGDIAHIDDDGFIFITDRKKDLIIPAGGKNIAPQPIENELKKSLYIDNAALVGDRRPYIVALLSPDQDALASWAEQHGLAGSSLQELLSEESVQRLFSKAVGVVNANLGRFEQVKKFRILPRPLTIEDGDLTPTMKVKRRVVEREFADLIEEMYASK